MSKELVEFLFQDIIFSKVSNNNNEFDIFASRIPTKFSNGNGQFLIVFARPSSSHKQEAHLHELNWFNFQSRTLNEKDISPEFFKLDPQKWSPPPPSANINPALTLVEKRDRSTLFTLPDGSEVALLHDEKKNSKEQYGRNMHLVQSLLTFMCTIKLVQPRKQEPESRAVWI